MNAGATASDAAILASGPIDPGPVDRERLARHLEVPSAAELDDATRAEIDRLEQGRRERVDPIAAAVAFPVDAIDDARVLLVGGRRVECGRAFARQLRAGEADWLVLAIATLGPGLDAAVRARHLEGDPFGAFVLEQWGSTLVEQARARLALSLCPWADARSRALMPYGGPGYGGWPLRGMASVVALMPEAVRPVLEVLDSGMVRPLKTIVVVHGVSPRRMPLSRPDQLAQCFRCGMPRCRYRVVDADPQTLPIPGNSSDEPSYR
jgi:hypothetical protein